MIHVRGKARLRARGWGHGARGKPSRPLRLGKWERLGVKKGDSPHAVPVKFSESARSVDILVEPAWIAKGLDLPDVRVWEQAAKPEAEKYGGDEG